MIPSARAVRLAVGIGCACVVLGSLLIGWRNDLGEFDEAVDVASVAALAVIGAAALAPDRDQRG